MALLLLSPAAAQPPDASSSGGPVERASLGVVAHGSWAVQPVRLRPETLGLLCQLPLLERGTFSTSAVVEVSHAHTSDSTSFTDRYDHPVTLQTDVLALDLAAELRWRMGRWALFIVLSASLTQVWLSPIPYDSDLGSPNVYFGLGAGPGVSVDLGRVRIRLQLLHAGLLTPNPLAGWWGPTLDTRLAIAWLF